MQERRLAAGSYGRNMVVSGEAVIFGVIFTSPYILYVEKIA